MTRDPGSWWGLAAFAPAATIAKFTRYVALVDEAAADVGRHVRLAASDQRDRSGLQLGRDPVGRSAGPAQRLDLVRILHRPEGAGHLAGASERGQRQQRLEVDEEAGPRPISDRHRPRPSDELGDDRHRVLRLVPRHRPNTSGRSTTRGASSRGTTNVASRSTGTTNMVSRSSGIAS